jgi:HK97 gp10 family phage protein
MADIVTVNIKGLDDLQKALEEKSKEARLALRIALSAGGGDVKRAMQDTAPVEEEGVNSGFLRDHINVKTRIFNGGLSGSAFIGPSTAAYPDRSQTPHEVSFITRTGKKVTFTATKITAALVGRFLEFGTRTRAAHPWMTRAWESSKETALAHIIAKLKEQLKIS